MPHWNDIWSSESENECFSTSCHLFWARPPQRDHTPTYSSAPPLWNSSDLIWDYLLNSPCFGPSSIDSISLDLSVVINTPWLVFCHHSFLSILIMWFFTTMWHPQFNSMTTNTLVWNKTIKKLSQRLLVIDVSLNKHHLFNKYIINPKYIILNQFWKA